MSKAVALVSAIAMFLFVSSGVYASQNHVVVSLQPINASGVTGTVRLRQLANDGTLIRVKATDLNSGEQYLSIYYDNATCALVADSIPNDVIGYYTANHRGRGRVSHAVDDPLNKIHSVSVRKNDANHTLVACASF